MSRSSFEYFSGLIWNDSARQGMEFTCVSAAFCENLTNVYLYSCSTLKIYAAADKRDLLEPMLIWATPGQRGFPSRTRAPPSSGPSNVPPPAKQAAQAAKSTEAQKSAELAQLLQGIEKVDDDKRRSAVLDVVCSVEDILELPLYPDPPSIESGELNVNLLKHQVRHLQRLLHICIDPFLRAKVFSGAFSTKIRFCQRRKPINQFRCGNFARLITR